MNTKHQLIFNEITKYTFLFFLASFAGYLWEVLIYLVQEGIFRNRGFFYGPWLPVVLPLIRKLL